MSNDGLPEGLNPDSWLSNSKTAGHEDNITNAIHVIVPKGVSLIFEPGITSYNINIDVQDAKVVFQNRIDTIKKLNIYAENSSIEFEQGIDLIDIQDFSQNVQFDIFAENSTLTFPALVVDDLEGLPTLPGKKQLILDHSLAPNVNIHNIGGIIDFDAVITGNLNVQFKQP